MTMKNVIFFYKNKSMIVFLGKKIYSVNIDIKHFYYNILISLMSLEMFLYEERRHGIH